MTTLLELVSQHGDQIITVPDGTTINGSQIIRSRHPATTGKYRGWTIVKANTSRASTIDLSAGKTTFFGAQRIMLSGFKIRHGKMDLLGSMDRFIFHDCEFVFPIEEWHRQWANAGGGCGYLIPAYTLDGVTHPGWQEPNVGQTIGQATANQMGNPRPEGFRCYPYTASGTMYDGSPTNIGVYGCDFHDIGDTALFVQAGITVAGCRIWNCDDKHLSPPYGATGGISPNPSMFHADCLANFAGGPVHVSASWLQQRAIQQAQAGSLTDARWDDIWIASGHLTGFLMGRYNNHTFEGAMNKIRVFGQVPPYSSSWSKDPNYAFRVDFDNTTQGLPYPRWSTVAKMMPVTGLDFSWPSGVTKMPDGTAKVEDVRDHPSNPAKVWRAAHTDPLVFIT